MKSLRFFKLLSALLLLSPSASACLSDTVVANYYTIDVNQPFGFITKVRVSLQKQYSARSYVAVNLNYFYQIAPGPQVSFEWRRKQEYADKMDHLFYVKAGIGKSDGEPGFYMLGGAGISQRVYIDREHKLSLYCVQGFKLCPNIIGNHDTGTGGFGGFFYFGGPGAILDLQFNLGYRLQ